MLTRMYVHSRFSLWSVSTTVLGDGVKTMCGAFFRSTREDVVSVCRHIGSLATCRIVSFRGKGVSVFCPNKHFVRCAVRSAARQHTVGCIASTHRICDVGKCALISSFAVCFQVLCRVQGTPTEHLSSMCMCSGRHSRQTPTVEPMTAGTRRCFCHKQDLTEIC